VIPLHLHNMKQTKSINMVNAEASERNWN